MVDFHKSINRIILERYNEEVLSTFRNFNKYDLKLRKLDSDLDFLTKCFSNNLTPKFLEFKLYSCALRGGSDYKKFQKKLLNDELQLKRDDLQDAKLYRQTNFDQLKLFCSHIDFNHLISLVDKWNTKKELKFHSNHNRKLHNLGLRFSYKSLSPDDVIFNLTNKVLSDDQKNALSLGLKFCFNPMKLDCTRYFLAFESLFRKLGVV